MRIQERLQARPIESDHERRARVAATRITNNGTMLRLPATSAPCSSISRSQIRVAVPLFMRRLPISAQHSAINGPIGPASEPTDPPEPCAERQRRRQRPAPPSPVDTLATDKRPDRQPVTLAVPTDLLEQLRRPRALRLARDPPLPPAPQRLSRAWRERTPRHPLPHDVRRQGPCRGSRG